jgi:nucleotide-binding universal stress UspA family protein
VVQDLAATPSDPRDPRLEALRRDELAAREHLERRVHELPGDWEVVVDRERSVPRAIERTLASFRPGLVVMATHGRAGIAHLLLGSVAEAVVQYRRAPVLCVREPDHGVALPYRRILVPSDLSMGSRRAFPLAAELARSFGSEIVALHVAGAPSGAAASGTAGVCYEVEDNIPSEEGLKAFLMPDFLGLKITPRVLLGHAWDRIVEVARVERADLIAMSTHGRNSLADRVMGSHAERVVRHASCPVLVV